MVTSFLVSNLDERFIDVCQSKTSPQDSLSQ